MMDLFFTEEKGFLKVSPGKTIEDVGLFFNSLEYAMFFFESEKCKTREGLLMEFKEKLEFPDCFGFNWDALEDSLKNLAYEGHSKKYFLGFKDSAVLPEDLKGKEILKDVLKSASAFLKENHGIDFKSIFF
ncbi:MAG: barstar family protein [Elusimicrobia bacterium]|nr:barstar family protein [Elusimicrobiota bacterium]